MSRDETKSYEEYVRHYLPRNAERLLAEDPRDLLSDEQHDELQRALNDLAKLRRRAEAEGRDLVLP